MKQNVYDDQIFYNSYLHLRKTSSGLNDVLEIPAFRSLLPAKLTDKRILDLGCGFGEACNWYVLQGAAQVIGVDISQRMITKAKELYSHDKIQYMQLPIEDISFPHEQFDLVLSSLAFHYIADFKDIISKIYYCLQTEGFLIFSQEHPVVTAKKAANGWLLDSEGNKSHWILDNYSEEGLRKQQWFIEGVIKYHRTISNIINTLIETGFKIIRVLEPKAIHEAELQNEALKNERRRPPFLIIKAQKIAR